MLKILPTILSVLCFVASSSAADTFHYPEPPKTGTPDFFTVAENGNARCVIVIPPGKISPELKRAQETLRIYLELVTGTKFEVAGRVPEDGRGSIHLGETSVGRGVALKMPVEELPVVDGFVIATPDARTLVIRGASDSGTVCGVGSLLKRFVGVHRCWVGGDPCGIGDVVPRKPTLRLPQMEWRDWPRVFSRQLSNLNSSGPPRDPQFASARIDDWLRLDYTIPSNESYYRWLPAKEHGAAHPEYYPLLGGKRFVPPEDQIKSWQPCVSNPAVAETMALAVIAWFDANPQALAVNFAVNDGTGDCECANCRAMDAPGADYGRRIGLSDRYIRFSNRVAELVAAKHPTKHLAFLSYGSLVQPPHREKLHPSLIPVITMSARANSFQRWDDWQATGARWMGFYGYHNDQHHFVLPKLDIHQTARRIRYVTETGKAAAYYKEATPMWPLVAPLLHVESELLWDPRRDVDEILREHYTVFFGPAAHPMAEFYGALESGYERWLSEAGIVHPAGKDIGSLLHTRSLEQFKTLNLDEIQRADAALAQAVEATKADATVSTRIRIVKAVYEFAALAARQYWLLQSIQSGQPQNQADALKVLATARDIAAAARTQAALKDTVLTQLPVAAYAPYAKTPGKPSNNSLFLAVEKDALLPEIGVGIASAFENVGTALTQRAGAAQAKAWWQEQEQHNAEPLLAPAFRLAVLRAAGAVPRPLVQDPSFETRPESELHLNLRSAANARVALSTTDAHTGKRSIEFVSCGRASVSETVPAKPGASLRITAWIKRGEDSGDCQIEIEPRAGSKRLRAAVIPFGGTPDVWSEVTADFTAPASTTSVTVIVRVTNQPSDTHLWVDDLSISAYEPKEAARAEPAKKK